MSEASPSVSWTDVSAAEETVDFNAAACCASRAEAGQSPIDDFYAYQESVMVLGDAQQLQTHDVLGRILLLALVSGVESYLRNLLSQTINHCQFCRSQASDQSLTLAAVDYYEEDKIGLGLFENISFAGAAEIVKQTKRISGIDIKDGSSIATAVKMFDGVAQLRHAAVHSRGAFSSKNVVSLGLNQSDGNGVLVLQMPQIHSIAGICRTTVRAYNRFLYQELFRRWLKAGLLKGDWSRDKGIIVPLFSLFRSERDGVGPSTAYQAYTKFRRGG